MEEQSSELMRMNEQYIIHKWNIGVCIERYNQVWVLIIDLMEKNIIEM